MSPRPFDGFHREGVEILSPNYFDKENVMAEKIDPKFRSVYSGGRLPITSDTDIVGVYGTELSTISNLEAMGITATLGCPDIAAREEFLNKEIERLEKLRAQQQGNRKPRPQQGEHQTRH
jgi:hypothetical protein